MSAIDIITEHFKSLDQGESKTFEKWQGLTFYKQPINLKQKGKLFKKMDADQIEGLAYALIELALDEKGEPMFDLADKPKLMLSADPDTLSEVAMWLMETPEKKDIKKKNSRRQ